MGDSGPLNPKSAVQDVGVPAQLLRATGNLGSLRDPRSSLAWEPQPAFPEIDGERRRTLSQAPHRLSAAPAFSFQQNPVRAPGKVRASLQGNGQLTTAQARSDSTSPDAVQEQEQIRKASYDQGDEEKLSVSRPISTSASSIWTRDDPFTTSRYVTNDQTRPHSNSGQIQMQPEPYSASDITTDEKSHNQEQPRRNTLEALVDALVPETFQRRFTNSSFIRRSSIWQTYEMAKKRGVELQRSKAFQLTFEYTIYCLIILFVYFILIGVPLWKGTVYWIWWVVAHKFVIAGGFAITVGIAFL